MGVILNGNVLTLAGDVGAWGGEDSYTYSDVVRALTQVPARSTLEVHINSGGGDATEGCAIHSLLSARAGTTNVVIEGIAASAASLIAMAGETITMKAGSVMMIHDLSTITIGTMADHQSTMDALETMCAAYAQVYADRSGKSVEQMRDIMRAEVWFTPDQAVAEGFADEVSDGKSSPFAAFDYRIFANAPKSLKALAKRKNWSLQPREGHPFASSASAKPKGNTMPPVKEPGADALAAARRDATARLRTITSSAEAAARPKLAAYLAYETDMDPDAAEAILMVAAKEGQPSKLAASRGGQPLLYTDADLLAVRRTGYLPGEDDGQERLNGVGLNGFTRPDTASESGLVAAMKRRHNVK